MKKKTCPRYGPDWYLERHALEEAIREVATWFSGEEYEWRPFPWDVRAVPGGGIEWRRR